MTPADLDALIARLENGADYEDRTDAAAALAELRDENASLELWGKATFEAGFQERQRADRAEQRIKELEAQIGNRS